MSSSNTYDGIIIGAGHHGMILGSYLAKAGLKILLVERRLGYGGGLSTEEVTLPGFYHNLHATNLFNITKTPWYRDLQLSESVPMITPDHELAQPHDDGSALVFSRDLETTLASIGKFSKKDAETFREWNRRTEEMTSKILMGERYAPPLSQELREQLLSSSTLGSEFLELTQNQPLDVVKDLFENEHVRVLFMFRLSLFGTVLKEALGSNSPTGSLVRAFDLSQGYEIAKGGTWNLARGLMETFIRSGGHFMNQAHVSRINVENGKATGITLADGREIRATGFVSSTLDPTQTFQDLVGYNKLETPYQEKVSNFKYTEWCMFTLNLALKESPKYSASEFDPNVNHALKYNLGTETMDDLFVSFAEAKAGIVPERVQFGAGALTTIDSTQAPDGKHTAYAWRVVPQAIEGDPAKLDELSNEMTDEILDRWKQYAPNMTRDNVLGTYSETSNVYAKRFINMRNGDALIGALTEDQVLYNHFGYHTPIEGLYMSGSATHPNGGVSGGAGYITAGLIAKDLGIKPWWTPQDAESILRDLSKEEN